MTVDRQELQCLLEQVYRARGLDFREYKETTLTRRLSRRLRARGAKTYAAYAHILERDPIEYDRLFDDLTINVTGFFRDDVAFRALQEMAMSALMSREGKSMRVWSAGCATGQEPYSIAMLLLERLGSTIRQWDVTVLGTDIDAKALQHAREGVYGPKEVGGVRPAWLDTYFVHVNKGFCVRPALRQLVTFEAHNLVGEPPYQDLDLVVCRNVLIYFTPVLQRRVLKGFHKGLKRGGFLLLGKAEVPVEETRMLFHCMQSSAKLYRKAC